MKYQFKVNGKKTQVDTNSMARLLDVLREDLLLTGTKEGCGEGECGACTVWINGQVVNSCLVPIAQVEGQEVTTIEGLGTPEKLHPVQKSFLECGGAQCGICTPGMVMAAAALLRDCPSPNLDEVKTALAGNICRCTGYIKIFESVKHSIAQPLGETSK